jgi:hypothetical protein
MYVAEFESGGTSLRQILLLFRAFVDGKTPAALAWQERLGNATRHLLHAGDVEVTVRVRVAGNSALRDIYINTLSPRPDILEAAARDFLRLNDGANQLIELCEDRARHDAAQDDLPPICLRLSTAPAQRGGCTFVHDFRLGEAIGALGTLAMARDSGIAWQSSFRAYRADAEARRIVHRNRIAIDEAAGLPAALREHQQAIAQRFNDATLLYDECLWVEPEFEAIAREVIATAWRHGPGHLGLPDCTLDRVEGPERDVRRSALHPALFDPPSPLVAAGAVCAMTAAVEIVTWQPPAAWHPSQMANAVTLADAAEGDLQRVETRLVRLEQELARRQMTSVECTELRKAIAIGREDPAFALVKARQILEGIVGRLYRQHRPNIQGKALLFDMIRDLTGQSNRPSVLPRHIGNYLDTVRVLGNLEAHRGPGEGANDATGGLSRNDLELSLMMMLNVIEWFLLEHAPPEAAERGADT